jgi:hypothetical protein
MLDRTVVKQFLKDKFDEVDIDIPKDISKRNLVETFCLYTEDDYYEWLNDNFKSFFNCSNPDWKLIRELIKKNLLQI